jgi:hypothetical protein
VSGTFFRSVEKTGRNARCAGLRSQKKVPDTFSFPRAARRAPRWGLHAVVLSPVALSVIGCSLLLKSYPDTFVTLPPRDVVELSAPLRDDCHQVWAAVVSLLESGWVGESGWRIATADKDAGYIRTDWKYGYSCYRFGDYRRRITVRLSPPETPHRLTVETEAQRRQRTSEFLWWGGQPTGWIPGYDPVFQQKVYMVICDRLGTLAQRGKKVSGTFSWRTAGLRLT